jgi:hypothetical protein
MGGLVYATAVLCIGRRYKWVSGEENMTISRRFYFPREVFLLGIFAACSDTYPTELYDYREAVLVAQERVVFTTGLTETQQVWIGNLGTASAQIESVAFVRGGDVFTQNGLDGLQLERGEEGSFFVTYAPGSTDERGRGRGGQPTGTVKGLMEIRWDSHDPETQYMEVELVANRLTDGQIEISEQTFEFGVRDPGSKTTQNLHLSNVGPDDVTLRDIEFVNVPGDDGLAAWGIGRNGAPVRESPPSPFLEAFSVDPDLRGQFPLTLAAQQELDIPIRFEPHSVDRVEALLQLEFDGSPSSNIDYGSIVVSGGTENASCLRLLGGNVIDFGVVPLGETVVLERTLTGCYLDGDISRVDDIYVVGNAVYDPPASFVLTALDEPDPDDHLRGPTTSPVMATFELSYTATESRSEQSVFLRVDLDYPSTEGQIFRMIGRTE